MMPPGSVLLLPALGVPTARYVALADAVHQRLGLPAAVLNWPAPRNWHERLRGRPDIGYRDLVQEVQDRATEAVARHKGRGVLLLGHSLGGQLSVLAAGLGVPVAGIVLVACGTSHWSAWPAADQTRKRLEMLALSMVIALMPWYPGAWFGFGGHQPRRLMRDWSALALRGRFDAMRGLEGAEARMAAASPPVLALTVKGDAYAPSSTTDTLLSKLPRAAVQRAHLDSPALRATDPVKRHSAWLHEPGLVVDAIEAWLAHGPLTPAH